MRGASKGWATEQAMASRTVSQLAKLSHAPPIMLALAPENVTLNQNQ